MTAVALIEELSKLPPETEVWLYVNDVEELLVEIEVDLTGGFPVVWLKERL